MTIDQVGWHTNVSGNPERIEQVHARFRYLVGFLAANGLLANQRLVDLSQEPMSNDFSVSSEDLTTEGRALMKSAYDKWLLALDRGSSLEGSTVLQRALARLRQT